MSRKKTKIVLTGYRAGGAILHREVWTKLMETSLVVWLQADVHTISSRLSGDSLSASQRPSLTGEDMIQEITAVLAERDPLYRQGAQLIMQSAHISLSGKLLRIFWRCGRHAGKK